MKKNIYAGLFVMLGIAMLTQGLFLGGFKEEFFQSLVPNIITEVLGIIITLLFVENLLEIRQRKEETRVLREIIGIQYETFLTSLTNIYLHFVIKTHTTFDSKDGPKIEDYKDILLMTIENIADYVNDDFVKKPIEILQIMPDPQKLFTTNSIFVDYQIFCEDQFKKPTNNLINQFMSQYMAVIPVEIKNSIFRISDRLRSNILVTPRQHGLNYSLENA